MDRELREKLLQLKDLVDLGLLSGDEFQAQKTALIASAMGTTPAPQTTALDGATSVTWAGPATSGPLNGPTTVDPRAGIPNDIGNYRILGPIGAGGMG